MLCRTCSTAGTARRACTPLRASSAVSLPAEMVTGCCCVRLPQRFQAQPLIHCCHVYCCRCRRCNRCRRRPPPPLVQSHCHMPTRTMQVDPSTFPTSRGSTTLSCCAAWCCRMAQVGCQGLDSDGGACSCSGFPPVKGGQIQQMAHHRFFPPCAAAAVLRCLLPGRPTADCLFCDVNHDGRRCGQLQGSVGRSPLAF